MKGTAKSEPLTIRETFILGLAAQGYSNKEIAAALGIKYQTVKNNFHKLTQKLGAKNNVHALKIAIQAGLMKIEMIADEIDESLPPEERARAKIDAEIEIKKVEKMSKKEFEGYMEKCNKRSTTRGIINGRHSKTRTERSGVVFSLWACPV